MPNDKPAAPFTINPVRTRRDLEVVAELFAAYATSLPVDLEYQDFDSELTDLPGKYGSPEGELLVAWDAQGEPVACVGLRPFDNDGRCEMKRLYVVPKARSFGLGRALTDAVISAARDRGYTELLLDTLPTMTTAGALYEGMGFRRIEPYYGPTPPGTIFMKRALSRG